MKQIRLNAFDMNCVGHIQQGLWRHPRDRSMKYTSLEHWVDLARLLERGLFDGLFLADVLGVYDVHGGSAAPAIAHAVQVPVGDPLLLIPAMAYATEHLGFGVTANLSYEPPFTFCPADVDARSPDEGADRVECGDRVSGQRGAGDGVGPAAQPMTTGMMWRTTTCRRFTRCGRGVGRMMR